MGEIKDLFEYTGNPLYKSPLHEDINSSFFKNQSKELLPDWYKDSVFYQVWLKAFCDSNADSVGDIEGLISKLDYIYDTVACDAIWLSPVFECGFMSQSIHANMHGYDTVDFYKVNALFGSEKTLLKLIDEVHKRGMKIIFDYVPNHTSRLNQWFIDSENKVNGKDNWYMWAPQKYDWHPISDFKFPCWTESYARAYLGEKNKYWYGAFGGYMPDLNYRNYEVQEEMANVVRYWLNRGFDGIRIDAVRYLFENPGKDNQRDTEETHEYFTAFQKNILEPYNKLFCPKMMVGEAWVENNREKFTRYFGKNKDAEFNMLFDFDFTRLVQKAIFNGSTDLFKAVCRDSDLSSYSSKARLGYMLCNHDALASMPASLYSDRRQLKFATALLLLSPQTPFVYNGTEFGQKDACVPGPFDDIKMRYPLNWELMHKDSESNDSLLALHRNLILLRKKYSALRRGKAQYYTDSKDTHGWTLDYENQKIRCTFNLKNYSFAVYKIDPSGLEEKLYEA